MSVKISIYDPALCCSTGICGPSVDPELVRIAGDLESLRKRNADVERFNLAMEPGAFAEHEQIRSLLQDQGPEVLPVTVVNGEIRKTKAYPSTQELSEWTGISAGLPPIGKKPLKLLQVEPSKDKDDCCTPGSGCC